jgi:P2 family phage contractile tail tube protein
MSGVNVVRDKLINFEVFKSGNRKLGMADVTLPKIGYKTSTMSGAGIGGEIEMPTPGQTESLELEISWRTMNEDVSELLELKSHDLEIRGANEQYDAATGEIKVQAVKVNVRCLPKTGDMGSFKPADHTDSKSTMEVTYIKVTIDGVRKIEIDKLNYIHFINGTDYLGEVRKALGL